MNNSMENLDPADKEYWEQPHRFALVKEKHNQIDFYSIFAVDRSELMMTLIDDFEYGKKLTNKMIENGVRIFGDFESLVKWHQQKKTGDGLGNVGNISD